MVVTAVATTTETPLSLCFLLTVLSHAPEARWLAVGDHDSACTVSLGGEGT